MVSEGAALVSSCVVPFGTSISCLPPLLFCRTTTSGFLFICERVCKKCLFFPLFVSSACSSLQDPSPNHWFPCWSRASSRSSAANCERRGAHSRWHCPVAYCGAHVICMPPAGCAAWTTRRRGTGGKRERGCFRLLSLMTSAGPVQTSSASSSSATAEALLGRLSLRHVHLGTSQFLRG